jgi:hypothetical protein
MAICMGAGLMILDMFLSKKPDGANQTADVDTTKKA